MLHDDSICPPTHDHDVEFQTSHICHSGFKVQTIKLSMPGFMDQTSKPSYMPNKVWLNNVDACWTYPRSVGGQNACDASPSLGLTSPLTLVNTVFITHVLLLLHVPMWASHGLFSYFWSFDPSFHMLSSPSLVHCVWTLSLTFSITCRPPQRI